LLCAKSVIAPTDFNGAGGQVLLDRDVAADVGAVVAGGEPTSTAGRAARSVTACPRDIAGEVNQTEGRAISLRRSRWARSLAREDVERLPLDRRSIAPLPLWHARRPPRCIARALLGSCCARRVPPPGILQVSARRDRRAVSRSAYRDREGGFCPNYAATVRLEGPYCPSTGTEGPRTGTVF
jgi:hypothetical protein